MTLNWAGNVAYAASSVQHPTGVDQVQALVGRAGRVRAVGSGHSFNRIADTTGTLLALDRLPRCVEVDSHARAVRISGGLRYGDLGPALRQARLALPNTASLPHISVVGSTMTATHGSGVHNPVLASSVRSLTLVTPDGDLRTVERASHPLDFDGWVVSLGRLGVVVELVLDLVPEFQVAQTVVEDVDEALVAHELTSVLASAYSVSVFTGWNGGGTTQVWLKHRVDDEAAWAGTTLWGGHPADGPRHPISGMPVEHATVQMGVPGPWIERLPHFRLDFMPSSGHELQSEYFVTADLASSAWAALARLEDALAPVLQAAEVRAVAADAFWMSPTRGEAAVAFHFTWVADADAVRPAVDAVESALAPFDARPHWGKVFFTSPDRLAELYPRLVEFRELVAEVDPGAKLGNAPVDGWLGLDPPGQLT